jgi:hypothetical protein
MDSIYLINPIKGIWIFNHSKNTKWRVIMRRSIPFEQLTPAAAHIILGQLPQRIQKAFVQRAAEIDYPLEAVLEMAMAGYLDREAKRKRDESRSHL